MKQLVQAVLFLSNGFLEVPISNIIRISTLSRETGMFHDKKAIHSEKGEISDETEKHRRSLRDDRA